MLDAVNTSTLVLAQAAASISRSELRWEYANAAAAVLLLSIGLAAIALFGFLRRARDLTLIYFGLFAILYAVRLLAYLPSFRSLFDESPVFWSYVGLVISNILIFPGGLFLYQVVGEHLRRFLRWLLIARAAIAALEILATVLGVSLAKLLAANNIKVLATLAATGLFAAASRFRPGPRSPLSHEIRVLVAGFLVWLLSYLPLHPNSSYRSPRISIVGAMSLLAMIPTALSALDLLQRFSKLKSPSACCSESIA
jgi:hypothetical protein